MRYYYFIPGVGGRGVIGRIEIDPSLRVEEPEEWWRLQQWLDNLGDDKYDTGLNCHFHFQY
jgi:hypothetical protein